jgi:hypothetical protein
MKTVESRTCMLSSIAAICTAVAQSETPTISRREFVCIFQWTCRLVPNRNFTWMPVSLKFCLSFFSDLSKTALYLALWIHGTLSISPYQRIDLLIPWKEAFAKKFCDVISTCIHSRSYASLYVHLQAHKDWDRAISRHNVTDDMTANC